MKRCFFLGMVGLIFLGACAGVTTPRQHYIEALNLKMSGDSYGYFDRLLYLASKHPDTRPGRRARSILMSSDLSLSLGGALWGAARTYQEGADSTPSQNYSDVRGTLETLFLRQAAFKREAGRYCESFEDCGFNNLDDSGYVYFMGARAVVGGGGQADPKGLRLDGLAVMSALGIAPISTEQGFLAAAVGNVDRDGDLDVWIVDHTGLLVQVLKD